MNPFADFVMQVDHHMGQLLDAVAEAGIDDQTLILFTSDNGCSPAGNFKVLKEHGHDPSAGFRGHKADIYEGGHRVPLIARWPGKIDPGRTTSALTCLTDVYATLQEITEQEPQEVGGEDGYSLAGVFSGDEATGRKLLISHSISGKFAIRKGPWKLCMCAGSGGWSAPREAEAKKKNLPPIQLYNLEQDKAEQNNLAEKLPEKVEELKTLLQQTIDRGRSNEGPDLQNDRKVKF